MAQNTSYKKSIFDRIALVYGLFYARQKRMFCKALDAAAAEAGLEPGMKMLDVGCGTGALCDVLSERGLKMTGVDPARGMLEIAQKKNAGNGTAFICASALERLPFEDNSFDVSIASYVAHGMSAQERAVMYSQMRRVTKGKIIIYDFNANRSAVTTIIEKMEGGDYFGFIETAEAELQKQFGSVRVLDVAQRASWYIVSPKNT